MFNLIRMNFYRLIHAKSTYIVTVCMMLLMTVITITNVADIRKNLDQKKNQPNIEMQSSDQMLNDNDMQQMRDDKTQGTVFAGFSSMLAGDTVLLFVIIFTVMFVNAEEKNGFIKNIGHRTKRKWDTFLAKIPALLVFTVVNILLYFIIHVIIYKIRVPEIEMGVTSDSMKFFGLILLAHIAMMVITAAITTLARSTAAGMVISLLPCFGIGLLVAKFLNFITSNAIKFENYFVVTGMAGLSLDQSNGDSIRALLVFIAWAAVAIASTMVIAEHRDVV